MNYSVVILGAGKGSRTNFERNKIFANLFDKNVLEYSLDFFSKYENCTQQILVVSEIDFEFCHQSYSSKLLKVIIGGNSRQKSIYNALPYISNEYVIVHDAARPIISTGFLEYFEANYAQFPVMTVGFPVIDTIHTGNHGVLSGLLDRKTLFSVYTPQAFKTTVLLDVHDDAVKINYKGTDDISLVLKFSGIEPYLFELNEPNIKLTSSRDLKILEVLINENR